MASALLKTKLNHHGRDPESPAERERDASGFTQIPHAFWADLMRLTRGKVQLGLVLYAWRMSAGLERKRGTRAPVTTPWLPWEAVAGVLGCSVKEAKDDALDADKRRVMTWEQRRGEVRFTVLWKGWEELETYTPPGRPQLVSTEPGAEKTVNLTKSSVVVRRGETSAPVTVPASAAVREICCASIDLDGFAFDSTVKAGRIQVHIRSVEAEGDKKAKVSTVCESVGVKRKPTSTSVTTSSPDVRIRDTQVSAALLPYGVISPISTHKLVEDCLEKAPGATVEQVCAAVAAVGASLGPSVRSAGAVILTAVPNCFASGEYRAPAGKHDTRAMDEAIARRIREKQQKGLL